MLKKKITIVVEFCGARSGGFGFILRAAGERRPARH